MFSSRRAVAGLFAAATIALAAPVAGAADRPSNAALGQFFEDVVFGAEAKDLVKGSTVIKKWPGPLRIKVSAMDGKMLPKADGGRELKLSNRKPSKTEVGLIRKHLKALLPLTGLKVESAEKTGNRHNLFISFVPRLAMHGSFLVPGADARFMRRLASGGVCYFVTAASKAGEILWGRVVVNNELPERDMDACLMEELTQTMGLPNDSDIVMPSMFNNNSQPTQINRTDTILIRTLYDRRLTPGMAKADAMKLAPGLLAAWNEKLP